MKHIELLLTIVGFVGIIFAAYFTTRLIGNRTLRLGSGKYLKLVDRITLGNEKTVCLIQVGRLYFLIAMTGHNVELLGQIEESELIPLVIHKETSFESLLGFYFRKRQRNGVQNTYTQDSSRDGYIDGNS